MGTELEATCIYYNNNNNNNNNIDTYVTDWSVFLHKR